MTLMTIHFIEGHKTSRKPNKTVVSELMPTTVMATGNLILVHREDLGAGVQRKFEGHVVPLLMDQTPKWSEGQQVSYD
jgi:hypothetical protein